MIATLPRLVLRLAGLCLLLMAFGLTPPVFVRAQSATDIAPPGGTTDKPSPPAAANAAPAKPANVPAKADATAPSNPPASTAPAPRSDSSAKSDSSADSDSSANSDVSGHYEFHEALKEFSSPKHTGDDAFERAAEAFPAFCKDWERKLHDRELNNEENVAWKDKEGFKTGTYLAYSPIKTCACKRSTGGVPIGELTYQETEYYLAGRTVEEARHAQPKPVGVTNTTEIFRWDRTKWDDGR